MSPHSRRIAALLTERAAVRDFCATLTPGDWDRPSRAAGWRVRDVLAHMGATAHAMLTPDLVTLMRTTRIERANDVAVAARSDRAPAELLAEYRKWSGLAAQTLRFGAAGPLGAIRIPLGELGRFPLRLMPSTAIFDWHTHLRHDLAPALELPAPPTDEPRMTAVLEWMIELLRQSHQQRIPGLDRPVLLTLRGLGGRTWRIEPDSGRDTFRVVPSDGGCAAAHITGRSEEFPVWATMRRPWRACDITVHGDDQLASRVLDSINLV